MMMTQSVTELCAAVPVAGGVAGQLVGKLDTTPGLLCCKVQVPTQDLHLPPPQLDWA